MAVLGLRVKDNPTRLHRRQHATGEGPGVGSSNPQGHLGHYTTEPGGSHQVSSTTHDIHAHVIAREHHAAEQLREIANENPSCLPSQLRWMAQEVRAARFTDHAALLEGVGDLDPVGICGTG